MQMRQFVKSFSEMSRDQAARRARQNQEWGTTKSQNLKSNSNNKKSQNPASIQKPLKKTDQVKE